MKGTIGLACVLLTAGAVEPAVAREAMPAPHVVPPPAPGLAPPTPGPAAAPSSMGAGGVRSSPGGIKIAQPNIRTGFGTAGWNIYRSTPAAAPSGPGSGQGPGPGQGPGQDHGHGQGPGPGGGQRPPVIRVPYGWYWWGGWNCWNCGYGGWGYVNNYPTNTETLEDLSRRLDPQVLGGNGTPQTPALTSIEEIALTALYQNNWNAAVLALSQIIAQGGTQIAAPAQAAPASTVPGAPTVPAAPVSPAPSPASPSTPAQAPVVPVGSPMGPSVTNAAPAAPTPAPAPAVQTPAQQFVISAPEASRLLGLALIGNKRYPEAVRAFANGYAADQAMVFRPLPMFIVGTEAELRKLMVAGVQYAQKVKTAEAWFVVAVLMQAQGRGSLPDAVVQGMKGHPLAGKLFPGQPVKP